MKLNKCYVHKNLKEILNIGIQDIHDDDDLPIVIVGHEGAGKSILAQQICGYLSTKLKTSFSVSNIHFSSENHMDFSLSHPIYTINILDETRESLNKMRGISKKNVDFNNFLSECRDAKQIHVIILPAFTDLDRYCAIWRSKIVIDVKKYRDPQTKRIVRGNYNIIRTDNKNLLNEAWEGKYKGFPTNMIWKRGTFKFESPINIAEYKEKKAKHRIEKYSSQKDEEKNPKFQRAKERIEILTKQRDNALRILYKNHNISGYKLAEVYGMTKPSMHAILNRTDN